MSSFVALGWMTQAIGLVTGFLLLRWLDVRDYAEYTFAFAFGSTMSQLVDLGFLDSLIGLIGDRADDKALIGSYMRAAMSLRGRLCAIAMPVSGIPFFLIAASHGWSYAVVVALFGSVVITLVTRAAADYYAVPVILARRYRTVYGAGGPIAGLRLACIAVLHFGRLLTGWVAAAVSAGAMAAMGAAMKHKSAHLTSVPRAVHAQHRRDIVRVIAPLLPNQLFAALQGQVTILIISVTGTTAGLAQVGALGRLAQIFVIVGAFNGYIVAPVIARTSAGDLAAKAVRLISALAAVLAAVTVAAFLWPAPMLWFLGAHYSGLADPARWYVLAASLTALSGTTYTMSIARRFIWWWGSIGQIVLTLAVEGAAAAVLNLHRVLDLQYFAVLTALTLLLTQMAVFAYGIRRGARVQFS